jgi:hypothetical protein
MTILGGFLASLQPTEMKANSYNTISAAPVLSWSPNGVKLPLDLQLDLENKYNKPNEVVNIHVTHFADGYFLQTYIVPIAHKALLSADEKPISYEKGKPKRSSLVTPVLRAIYLKFTEN